jgi:hypothetical protein
VLDACVVLTELAAALAPGTVNQADAAERVLELRAEHAWYAEAMRAAPCHFGKR